MSDAALSPLCYLLGYLTGVASFWWLARRRGLNTWGVTYVLCAGLIGGLMCGNIVQWIATGVPGKSIIGALAGGYASVIIYKQIIGLKRPLGDLFAFAVSSGEAIGRWGCYFGGCCYGKVAFNTWVIWQHGAWRYPTQIYSSFASAATFVILLILERKMLLPENGIFYVQGLLFCLSRFFIEFYRSGPVFLGGLTMAQFGCAAGLCFFGAKITMMLTKSTLVIAQ